MNKEIKTAKRLRGTIKTPGDKSISHRAIMLGSISEGTTNISGFLDSADCRSTIDCFTKLGVTIEKNETNVSVKGVGLHGLKEPKDILDVGNSGTTMRLISGILSGQPFQSTLTGDDSIRKRPMKRVVDPLSLMGANITSENGGLAPLYISPSKLHGIDYTLPVASAQIKSCVLLAGLYAKGSTSVTEISPSRDHTERMLSALGADLKKDGLKVTLNPGHTLKSMDIAVPGDISSAAYFIAAGLIHPDADILIENVNINPTRAGIISVIKDMGGKIELLNERMVCGEEVCDIHVCSSNLHGTQVSGDIIPTLIDELPMIAVMAAYADGKTIIKNAEELRKKESDRIEAVTLNLSSMGCDITPTDDGMIINGGTELHGASIKTFKDHRIAMPFAIPGLITSGITIDDPSCVMISFENFFPELESLCEN